LKTESQLNEDILKVITAIAEKYQELLKFIEEMLVPSFTEVTADVKIAQLYDYHESLLNLVLRYSKIHKETTQNRNGI
jgi:ribosome maturation protein Sdo1